MDIFVAAFAQKSIAFRLVININSAPGKRAELENLINYTDPDGLTS